MGPVLLSCPQSGSTLLHLDHQGQHCGAAPVTYAPLLSAAAGEGLEQLSHSYDPIASSSTCLGHLYMCVGGGMGSYLSSSHAATVSNGVSSLLLTHWGWITLTSNHWASSPVLSRQGVGPTFLSAADDKGEGQLSCL